ncbi:hypothetical protein BH09ACT12_BH09ACT12_13010 [soil metagenome]
MNIARDSRVALFLAARSFARGNANVTLMTVLMMAVVFISTMFLPSLLTGATSTINSQIQATMASDLIVTSGDDTSIDHASAYASGLAELSEVAATTGVRRVGTQISHGEESNAWGVDAIDPTSFAEVFTTPANLVEGEFLEPEDRHGIVLGVDIAGVDDTDLRAYSTSLKSVHAGDRVDVTLIGGAVETFTVRGIYRNHFPLSDQGAFITTAAADALHSGTDYVDSVERLYGAVDDLTSALESAASGTEDLGDGAAAVARSANTLAEHARTLATGADALQDGVADLASGASDLQQSGAQVASGATSVATSAAKLADQMDHTMTPTAQATADDAATIAKSAQKLSTSCPTALVADYCAQVSQLASSTAGLASEASASATALDTAGTSVTKLAGSSDDLADGAQALAATASRLSQGAESSGAAAREVTSSASELASGADRMAVSADSLHSSADRLAQQLRNRVGKTPPIEKHERDDLLDKLSEAAAAPEKNTVSRIYVRAAPGVTSRDLQVATAQVRRGMEFQTPDQVASAIQDQIDTFDLVNNIMRVISLVVAAITVFILTYVELNNRRRQIGIERAIGIRSTAIVGSYVLKSALNAVIGILIGVLVFKLLIVPLVAEHPFSFPNGDVTLVTEGATTRANTVVLLVVALLAALAPAVSAARIRILDAIWG